jgi:hypothetical protein
VGSSEFLLERNVKDTILGARTAPGYWTLIHRTRNRRLSRHFAGARLRAARIMSSIALRLNRARSRAMFDRIVTLSDGLVEPLNDFAFAALVRRAGAGAVPFRQSPLCPASLRSA